MIQTRTFSITRSQYFKILFTLRFRKRWWLYLLVVLMPVYFLKYFGENLFVSFIVVYCLMYVPVAMLSLLYFAYSKQNAIVFIPRGYEIDGEEITVITENKRGSFAWQSIIDVKELNEYWILYINKAQFMFISKNAFYERKDRLEFEKIVTSLHIKK